MLPPFVLVSRLPFSTQLLREDLSYKDKRKSSPSSKVSQIVSCVVFYKYNSPGLEFSKMF